jgi:hypothetical protein
MRIISKFSDYYDCGMKYGTDATCVYVRELKESRCSPVTGAPDIPRVITREAHKIVTKILKSDKTYPRWYRYGLDCYHGTRLRSNFKKLAVSGTLVVVFCGKVYPCLEFTIAPDGDFYGDTTKMYCYTFEQATDLFREHLSKAEQEGLFSQRRRRARWSWQRENLLKRIENFFSVMGESSGGLMDLHHKVEVPVMLLSVGGSRHPALVFNPVLKDIQFYRIVDNFTAYQELAMFVSGVLGGKSPKTIEVSNDIKIAKRGFDEWSFRKEPGKKRKL